MDQLDNFSFVNANRSSTGSTGGGGGKIFSARMLRAAIVVVDDRRLDDYEMAGTQRGVFCAFYVCGLTSFRAAVLL